jgi:Ca-activated chloride channel family protein
MRARIGTFAVVVLCLCTVILTAQTGGLFGVVRDASGGVLPGVTIEVSGPALGAQVRSVVSDQNGRYAITALPPGSYKLTFTLAGFSVLVRENVIVSRDATTNITVDMQVGGLKELVQVVAEAPVVDIRNARQTVTLAGVANAAEVTFALSGALSESATGAPRYQYRGAGESYAKIVENGFRAVSDEPLSTFSIDVDTASYANVRRFLNDGAMPPADAVRVEEMVNYFRFDYPQPRNGEPFSVTTELVPSPWNPAYRLALIGLQGRETFDDRTGRNLVFLIDVSGSMATPDKLPLVKNGMRMLADTLQPRDRVAIVVYAGHSGTALPSTAGDQKAIIHDAIERLHAGGSTNGAAGIRLAYELARQQFVAGGVNRVILATDGDFNVGVTSHKELLELIEQERRSGVFLTVLGVGTGNLKDSTMEMLADKGNGNYAYLDSIQEAQRVLVREASSTLVTIAKDVKIQVEFNPATVASYRLVGYENRLLEAKDFNDDRKDAGDIGAGHSVTALYEIVPVGAAPPAPSVDGLKYQQPAAARADARPAAGAYPDELMTVKLRYKDPEGETSRLIATVIRNRPQAMTANIGFASAVAELGLLLRRSPHSDGASFGGASFDAVTARARQFRGTDADGYRAEFIRLVDLARSLRTLHTAAR